MDAVDTAWPSWALGTDGHAQLLQTTLLEQLPSRLQGELTLTPDEGLIRSGNSLDLVLRGRRIGVIAVLGHPPIDLVSHPDTKDTGKLSSVFHRMFDPPGLQGVWLLQGVNYREPAPDPGQLELILGEHVIGHSGYFYASPQLTLRPGEGSEGHGSYATQDLPACIERSFFFLSNKLYGLCPWTAREGDIAMFLQGGRVPYLLRPVFGEKGAAGAQRYRLVGE